MLHLNNCFTFDQVRQTFTISEVCFFVWKNSLLENTGKLRRHCRSISCKWQHEKENWIDFWWFQTHWCHDWRDWKEELFLCQSFESIWSCVHRKKCHYENGIALNFIDQSTGKFTDYYFTCSIYFLLNLFSSVLFTRWIQWSWENKGMFVCLAQVFISRWSADEESRWSSKDTKVPKIFQFADCCRQCLIMNVGVFTI